MERTDSETIFPTGPFWISLVKGLIWIENTKKQFFKIIKNKFQSAEQQSIRCTSDGEADSVTQLGFLEMAWQQIFLQQK